MPRIAGALEALLAELIDYAGLYPPAALALPIVAEQYTQYLESRDCWMLRRLVLPANQLAAVSLRTDWQITLLVDDEPGPLPRQVETFETKGVRRLSLPTYCEAPLDSIESGYAKLRTGGVTPEAIPSGAAVAAFLHAAAAQRRPFKATAGLHHPIRSEQRLTYASDSPRAVMHGFLNVFVAASFAWHGLDEAALRAILEETDPSAFSFRDDELRWGPHRLDTPQIAAARRDFAHSFGSCSFEEPVSELRELNLLP